MAHTKIRLTTIPASWIALILMCIALAIVFHLYYHEGLPYTHDGENHVARFADYATAVKQGQIPPRIAPRIWSGVGYPVFLYNYPLANILSLPFSAIKISYVTTFKILMFSFVVFGIVGMWRWLGRWKLTVWSRLIGVSVWLSFPYLISLLYFRGNIGEVAAYSLIPWLFLSIEWVVKNDFPVWRWLCITALVSAFLLSHNVTAVLFWPMLAGYACLRFQTKWRQWWNWLWPAGLGLVLTFWFWLPALAEKSLSILDKASNNSSAASHSPTVEQLLISPLRFGFSYPGSIDSLSFSIGLTTLILIGAFVLVVSGRLNQWKVIGLSVLFCLIVLLGFQLQPVSSIWSIGPLGFIQFPWRLSIFIGSLSGLLAAIVWQRGPTFFHYGLGICLAISFIVIVQLHPADYVYKSNVDYASFPHSTSTLNENTPKTFTGTMGEVSDPVQIISGQGQIDQLQWRGNLHEYLLRIDSVAVVTERVFYFPGWSVEITNTATNEVLHPKLDPTLFNGWLSYEVFPGEYRVSTHFFEQTWDRQFGDAITVLGLSILLVLTARSIRISRHPKTLCK